MDCLSSWTILVTGGSSGIGFEMARQMAERGARVLICGRSRDRLEEATRKEPRLTAFACDLDMADGRESLFRFTAHHLPGLNLLVNNAGIARRCRIAETADLEEYLTAEWRTNCLAPVWLAWRFRPLLAQNSGTIANVTSALAHAPNPNKPNYSATKAALHSMTRSLREQFRSDGVRVVDISYPVVDTPFHQGGSPAGAMLPETAAAIVIRGLESGRETIHVGTSRALSLFGRLFPGLAMRRMAGSLACDNIQEKKLDRWKEGNHKGNPPAG